MRNNLIPYVTLLFTFYFAGTPAAYAADNTGSCLGSGKWAIPTEADVRPASTSSVLARARKADFVLLGEAHDNPDHHLWQLQTLGMLLSARDEMIIGMEMFPRRVQPALDRWVAGELTEAQFLQEADWNRVWGFDPDLYMPILRFARLNQLTLVALNVERSLVSEIGAGGWAAVAPERREGITTPAAAPEAYRELLKSSFQQHGEMDDSAFENFVQAQLLWDRAFAEGLAQAAASRPEALVVGVIGSGHLRYGHGVPHQLRSLGKRNIEVWLPKAAHSKCQDLLSIADAVFGVSSSERTPPPRLGVYLQDTDGGIEVRDVLPGSVAEEAGLVSGDRIMSAAGIEVHASEDIIALVRRQSPGTWLPMTVARNGEKINVVAKFPALLPAEEE